MHYFLLILFSLFYFESASSSLLLEKKAPGSITELLAVDRRCPSPEIKSSTGLPLPILSRNDVKRNITQRNITFSVFPPLSSGAERYCEYRKDHKNYLVKPFKYQEEVVDYVPVVDGYFDVYDLVLNIKKFPFTRKNISLALSTIDSISFGNREILLEALKLIPFTTTCSFGFSWPEVCRGPYGFGNVLVYDHFKNSELKIKVDAIQLNFNRFIEFDYIRNIRVSDISLMIVPQNPTEKHGSDPIVFSVIDFKQIIMVNYSNEILSQLKWYAKLAEKFEKEGYEII